MSVTMLLAYALAVAVVLSPAAWFLERAVTGLRLPTRGVWMGAMALCIGLPAAAFVSGPRQRSAALPSSPAQTVAPVTRGEIEVGASGDDGWGLGPALGPVADWKARVDRALASGAALLPAGDRVEAWIASVWGAASILVAMVLLVSMRRLRREADQCPDETLFGRRVKVSDLTGPATIGPLRPLVVIPRWARELPPHELELVLRHEGEHVRGQDTLLLAMGLVAVAACPWNPLIWWQVRRLKYAVEVDCDRRVLRSGVAAARYGALLVSLVSRRRLGSFAIPAIAGSIPLLERRLTVMNAVRERASFPKVAAASSAALLLVVVACTTEPPAATDAQLTDAEAVSEARGQEVVAIRVDRDGTARMNDEIVPIDHMDDVLAPFAPDVVVSLDVHEAARYRAVAALQDQLRAVGLIRVVFRTVESDAQRPPPDGSVVDDGGLPIVLPDTTMRDLNQVNVDPRNLLYLDVLPTGIVAASRGNDPGVREIAPRDVDALWRESVAMNPELIAVARTHPDAEYRHMYDVLDALRRADARRVSLQVAQ